jgi:dolichol-phosphate mannosyltransferase
MQIMHCAPGVAIIPAAFVSSAVTLIGTRLTIFDRASDHSDSLIRAPRVIISIIAYALLLRIFCNALAELIFEEAYYWNYAQHLAIGYLDHPPMVGWLIWVFTGLLGDTEFAVRMGSCLCWWVMAWYSYKLAAAVLDKEVALTVLLLVAVLPGFFSFGLIMLPDSPLLACWAGALYYLYRLLIENQRKAWLGAGIFMGLGLLSKYTMCLIGLGVIAFVLLNGQYRKWLLRPELYLSALLATLIFSPVIIWNARHGWVSFLFQSAGRMNAKFVFDLPDLVGTILFLLTPTGALAAIAIMWYRRSVIAECPDAQGRGAYGFLLTTTMLPLAIFFLVSLLRGIKIVWTAPLWLSLLPYMAACTFPGRRKLNGRLVSLVARAWPGTIVGMLLIYGAVLHYSALGFPGVPYPRFVPGLGMEHLASQIENVVDAFERSSNEKPLVVCMNKNKIASLVAFYRAKLDETSGGGNKAAIINNTTGNHYFGGESLMYEYWHPLEAHKKRVILLIGYKTEQFKRNQVQFRTEPISAVKEMVVIKNGKVSGHYFYQFLQADMA